MYLKNPLTPWVIVWLVAMLIIIGNLWRKNIHTVGLTASYLFNLAINHLLGAYIYTIPWWYAIRPEREYVYMGFVQSTYAILAFGAGSFAVVFVSRSFYPFWQKIRPRIPNLALPRAYLMTGLVCYAVFLPALERVPSVRILALSGWSLMIAGLCLAAWKAWKTRRTAALIGVLFLSLLFPFFTVLKMGFLSYGMTALLAILLFIASFYHPRWKMVLVGLAAIYVGLSFLLTYLRDRDELRLVTWYEQQSMAVRVQRVFDMVTHLELLDFRNEDQLKRIDARMNQNIQVGMSVVYLEAGRESFAKGETLSDALVAVVPRILWPSKPYVAGSTDLVSRYTGLVFAEGTSVGIGQVMEFYINFGTACVVVGFLILGALITYFDLASGWHLAKGDWQGCVWWFLPGLGFLQAGGSLVEVTSTIAASFVFCVMVHQGLLRDWAGQALGWARVRRRVP